MRSSLRNPAMTLLLTVATTAVAPQAAEASELPEYRPAAHFSPVDLVADPATASAGLLRQAQGAADAAHQVARDKAQEQAAHAAAQQAAKAKAVAEKKAAAHAAEKKARERAAAQEASYPDTLDGWIREALVVMHDHGIPGSYAGIRRNIMRESGGDPRAVNDWDVNAQRGTPSTGLLQVIRPTFEAYHVPGTAWSMTDPVANIAAACNYAAARYGSIDHVDSAY